MRDSEISSLIRNESTQFIVSYSRGTISVCCHIVPFISQVCSGELCQRTAEGVARGDYAVCWICLFEGFHGGKDFGRFVHVCRVESFVNLAVRAP